MYGTVARFRVKPGADEHLKQIIEEQTRTLEAEQVPGFIATYGYRMDAEPNEYYIVVMFSSKETYWANAQSPAQDDRYRQLLPLLESEPEWHDGEVVHVFQQPGQR